MDEGGTRFFVRTAMRSDLEAVRSLLVTTWHDTYDALIGRETVLALTERWHSMAALEQRLTQLDSEFLVADSGTEIAAMAFAQALEEGRCVYLRQLYVLPQWQGRGIGLSLLREVMDCFPAARRVDLDVEAGNTRAVGFYRAQGFAEIGRGRDETGVELVCLERPLAGG